MQHARGMSGQQAIDALLQAQRTGGTVAPEVTAPVFFTLAHMSILGHWLAATPVVSGKA